MPSYALPRSARLKRRSLIRPLFERGRDDVTSVASGCIRIVMRIVPRSETGSDTPVQVGFAPGRRAGSAVRRNRIKRKLREVYRLSQSLLVNRMAATNQTLTLMILYRGTFGDDSCIDVDLVRALESAARSLP